MADGDDIIVISEEPEPYYPDQRELDRDVLSPLLGSPHYGGSINATGNSYGSSSSGGLRNNNNSIRPRVRLPSVVSMDSFHVIQSSRGIPEDHQADSLNSRVAVSLYVCKKQVLNPYRKLLLVVGWQPIFDDADTKCRKLINILHPGLVMGLVVLGYVLQFASCFRRDSAFMPKSFTLTLHMSTFNLGNSSGLSPPLYNTSNVTTCLNALGSQFIVPDLFHSAAYIYSFYLLRFRESEHLISLVERTFLQTSQSDTFYFLSQNKLIRSMRVCLYVSVLWVLMSLGAQALHVASVFDNIEFRFMMPNCSENCNLLRILLVSLMLVSFVALDVVYVVVVMNYSIQCLLLMFYIEGLQEKVRQRLISFVETYREIDDINGHLSILNYNTALALSIVLFNFNAMVLEGILSLISNHSTCDLLQLSSSALSVLCWIFMILYPLYRACQLSGSCNSLRKLGHEVCRRPFRYQDTPQADLDSFLLYTSSLNMRTKIFLVPVRTSYIAFLLAVILFVSLYFYQSGGLPFTV